MDVKGTVMTVISVTLGVILCGSVLVPQSQTVIDQLLDDGQNQWASLISLVVTLTILGLVVAAIYMYTSSR